MQVSELIVTLQNEVAKSYTFISETKENAKVGQSTLHINIESVEVELPLTLSLEEVNYDPKKVKGLPKAFKKLAVPFTVKKGYLPNKSVTGKTVNGEVIGHVEKLDSRVSPESVGRMKIVFKLVIS